MMISKLTLKSSAEIDEPLRRCDVFTGAGRRGPGRAGARLFQNNREFISLLGASEFSRPLNLLLRSLN